MEFVKHEVEAVAQVINELPEKQISELHDLQLALVGGGIADPIFA
jgi:hypothetical protein